MRVRSLIRSITELQFFAALILSVSASNCFSIGPCSAAEPSGSRVKLLTGSVEHKEEMPPVEPMYMAGKTLKNSSLPKFPTNKFYSIPTWLAGKWHHDQQVTYYTYDYATDEEDRTRRQYTARGDDEIGWQQDKRGGIWQYCNAPYTTIVKGDGHYTVQISKSVEPVSVNPKQLVVRFTGIDLIVDAKTNTIVETHQNDKLQVYTRSDEYGPRYNRTVGSVKTFDQNGKPVRLSQVATIGVKTESFTPTNEYKGQDIKFLFHQYLLTRGLAKLVPTQMVPIARATDPPKPAQALKATQGVLKPGKRGK